MGLPGLRPRVGTDVTRRELTPEEQRLSERAGAALDRLLADWKAMGVPAEGAFGMLMAAMIAAGLEMGLEMGEVVAEFRNNIEALLERESN